MRRYLLDTGPLVAALRRGNSKDQVWAREQIRRLPKPLLTCDAVLTEASHFLGGPIPLLKTIDEGLVLSQFDTRLMANKLLSLTTKYADLPMDFADACLVCMAEQQPGSAVLTFDARDFSVYRLLGGRRINIITP